MDLHTLIERLGARPLAVTPHPDDEAWAMGGLLGALSDAGAAVSVLCATAAPSAMRHGELLRAVAAIGIAEARVVAGELPDAHLPDGNHPEALRIAIDETMRAVGSTSLLSLGPEGGYGHRDHIAVWQAVEAVAAAHPELAVAVPTHPEAVFGVDLFGPVRRWLRRAQPDLLADAAPQPPTLATTNLRLPEPLLARKRRALEAHQSQLPRGGVDDFLGPGVGRRLLAAESWALVAPATAGRSMS